jgi:predicted Zn-dependent protease
MHNLLIVVGLLLALGCSHAPETGRSQLIFMSSSQEIKLGQEAFAQVLQKEKIVTSGKNYEMVQRVGEKVALAADRLYPEAVRGYKWKFALIQDNDMVNAWALPGGKCAVYTGLLPVTKNEDGLAIIMAHEVAHVIVRHGAERASHGMVGAAAVTGMAMTDMDKRDKLIVLSAYGLGVALPFSRTQESEADQIGLYIAAYAGFDPHEAIPLWRRMGKENNGAPPEFMSTHPSSITRIQQLRGWMPKAMLYYDSAIAHEEALQAAP